MVRKAVDMAMRLMGEQFVTGETIDEALRHAVLLEARGFRYSYDMLGESAVTAADAARYRRSYEDAIHAIGRASDGRGVHDRGSRGQSGRGGRQQGGGEQKADRRHAGSTPGRGPSLRSTTASQTNRPMARP